MKKIIQNILFPPKFLNRGRLLKKIRGKTVLITGASFGIGESVAKILAEENVHLVLVARTNDKLIELKVELEKRGIKVTIIVADLYKDTDVNAICDFIRKNEVDIFISNAGKSIRRSIYDSLDREQDFIRTMQLNYYVPVKIISCLLKRWKGRAGHIINISALNVLFPPQPLWAGYQASKSAFDQWMRSVKPEINSKGIVVSTLYLPLVKTRMIEPTAAYKNVPAMLPENVAKVIARKIIHQRFDFKPWWYYFSKPFIYFLNPIVQILNRNKFKKNIAQ